MCIHTCCEWSKTLGLLYKSLGVRFFKISWSYLYGWVESSNFISNTKLLSSCTPRVFLNINPLKCMLPYGGQQTYYKPSIVYIRCNFPFIHPNFNVIVDYRLYGIDFQNKISWFSENQHNWFMSSFILSSKSEILNTIFQNKLNQIMEITPSHSACHSKFVTIFF